MLRAVLDLLHRGMGSGIASDHIAGEGRRTG